MVVCLCHVGIVLSPSFHLLCYFAVAYYDCELVYTVGPLISEPGSPKYLVYLKFLSVVICDLVGQNQLHVEIFLY